MAKPLLAVQNKPHLPRAATNRQPRLRASTLGMPQPWVYTHRVPDFVYPWQQSVLEAFVAPPNSLAVKIAIAERAIATRLVDTDLGEDERLVIKDALRALRVLLRETTAHRNEEIPNEDIA